MRALFWTLMSIVVVQFVSVVLLCGTGLVLTLCEADRAESDMFFSYRIYHLDNLPAWFILSLALLLLNGVFGLRLAVVEAGVHSRVNNGVQEYGLTVPLNPLRLLSLNLVFIPVLIGLFLLMRNNLW